MKQRIDNFLGGTLKAEMPGVSNAYTQNMYFEQTTDGKVTKSILRSIDGLKLLSVEGLPSGTPRGSFVASNGPDGKPRPFVAIGSGIYAIDRDGGSYTATLAMNIGNGTSRISMCETGGNDPRLCVATGSQVLVCNIKSADPLATVRSITLPHRQEGNSVRDISPTFITYQYGYLTVNDAGSDNFYRSYHFPFEFLEGGVQPSEDVFTYDPLDETSSEFGFYIPSDWCPDNITAMVSTNAKLFTFGPKSMQLFNYTNDSSMPFNSPDTSALSIGILAPESAAVIGNKVFWLGSSDVGQFGIYKTSDTNPTRISNADIEREIAAMQYPEEAVGFCWTESAHVFYALSFNSSGKTFVYDDSTGMWHSRVSTNPENGIDGVWRYKYPFMFDSRQCFLCSDGIVEQARPKFKTENGRVVADEPWWKEHDGNPIVRMRRGGAVIDGFTAFFVDNILFSISNGYAAPSTERPKCIFRYSRNGTTMADSRIGQMGFAGEYSFMTQFPRLGMGTSFVFELSCSDNVPFTIVGCVINWTSSSRGF